MKKSGQNPDNTFYLNGEKLRLKRYLLILISKFQKLNYLEDEHLITKNVHPKVPNCKSAK